MTKTRERAHETPMTIIGSEWEDDVVDTLRRRLGSMVRFSPRTVHDIRIKLDRLASRSNRQTFCARVTFEVDGQPLHAHAEARTAEEVVALVEERVRTQFEHRSERRRWARRHDHGIVATRPRSTTPRRVPPENC